MPDIEQLRQAAEQGWALALQLGQPLFVWAGGPDPSSWPAKYELGSIALAAAAAVLAIVVASIEISSREAAR